VQSATNEISEPDDVLTPPDAIFIANWQSVSDVEVLIHEMLGSATRDAERYTGTSQRLPSIRHGYDDYITLPNGRILIVEYSFARPSFWQIS